jgi:hypothetical protein
MSREVKYMPDEKVIAVTATGPVSPQDVREQVEEAVKLSKKTQATLALVDFREALVKFDSLDVSILPGVFKHIGMPRKAQIAVIQPKAKQRSEPYRLVETMCHDYGFNVKVFDTVPEAWTWLKRQSAQRGAEQDTPATD